MRLNRRRFTAASGALLTAPILSCTKALEPVSMTTTTTTTTTTSTTATLRHRPATTLPKTTLSWLSLRDHFVATVGAQAGRGRPLGDLLVLADATFSAGSRFPLHPHEEMEILSIVIDGDLSHHGDQAHGATIPARHAQLISARSGMVHAEGNDTAGDVRMLQIWLRPTTHGGAPAYFDVDFTQPGRHVIAGKGGMPLRADVRLEWIDVVAGQEERLTVAAGRAGYLMPLKTAVQAGALVVADGDGLVVEHGGDGSVVVVARGPGAVLWIDVAV